MNQTAKTLSHSPARQRKFRLSAFEKPLFWISAKLNVLGMAGLAVLTLVTCGDIFVRVVYLPIKGIFDLVQLITGLSIALTVPQTIIVKGNVVVNLIVDRFPERIQDAVETVTLLFSIVLLGLITAGVFSDAISAFRVKEVSETLRIPLFYQKGSIAVPLTVATIVLIVDFLNTFGKAVKK